MFPAYNRKVHRTIALGIEVLRRVAYIVIVDYVSLIPWFVMLWLMFDLTFIVIEREEPLITAIAWFANPTRVAFHIAAKAVKAVVVPLLRLGLGLILKRILGLNTECRGTPSQMSLFRQFVNSKLLSQKKLRGAFSILDAHYEVVSIYEAMGAKVGRRSYWPGFGINCMDPEPVLEIGDDDVSGSRSEIFTTDGIGSEKVVIGNGAMIADRVVLLLPGTRLGRSNVRKSASSPPLSF
ncbi:hypothetical protein E1B28_005422 [Marasmius oreades]|uniref:Uncharacterized protein n=1 Tax=Marasmius oreades TaxID=181124 RepID=A0A9P7S3U1_9AGAR|nr:uncharacterized protein E1B28_005422 [Marasmius oreades]KAG7094597.1 hypothetical protein E1B28_005422 [Marasmius oreades]